uniref:NADH-ubiquinone oxidoreductase chain 2 n=1 Tax=Tetrodontophora bielanensis TaxID=48717 RepID=Q9B517_TETBI|nr:NADH dehydrogenase subunit 2 [Tetrodontophora bielanensis]AAK30940.1 NADH dehydrogenase subunit 2 [Tetrodontophora bielanensis]
MLNYFKYYLYLSTLLMGTMMAISSSSWFTSWLGLEINLMSLIPILINKINPYTTETAIKYFLTQAMASVLIIFSSIMMFSNNTMNSLTLISMLILLALSIKMGAAPFHFWLPQIIQTAQWPQIILILTWQKIAPMMLLMFTKSNLSKIIIYFCCIVGVIGAINQTSIKKILAYSSILHTGWMISAAMSSENIWSFYFILYSTISISLMTPMASLNLSSVKELFFLQMNQLSSYLLLLSLLSLAGIPPLLGFAMKMITLISLMSVMLDKLIIVLLIMSSLISLYYYLRIMYSSMLATPKFNKINKINFMKTPINSFVLTLSFLGNLMIPSMLMFT